MPASLPYPLFADLVLTLHAAIVVFVIAGLALIIVGNNRGWCWVNALCFRLVHLAAIVFVVVEAWLGITCPLTALEMWLRTQAGTATYHGSFIEHWLHSLLYHDLPPWVFLLGYTLFGLLVLATWIYFPLRLKRSGKKGGT